MRSLASFIAAAVLFSAPSWAPNPAKETDSSSKDHVAQSGHCPADLDGNGQVRVPDLIMLLGAWGPCPLCGNGVVDPGEECDPPNGVACDDNCQFIGPCCLPHSTPGCEDPTCESAVCAGDSSCCNTAWDDDCAVLAAELCPECFGLDCCFEHFSPRCTDPDCESSVCSTFISCCTVSWWQDCADLAAEQCEQCFP